MSENKPKNNLVSKMLEVGKVMQEGIQKWSSKTEPSDFSDGFVCAQELADVIDNLGLDCNLLVSTFNKNRNVITLYFSSLTNKDEKEIPEKYRGFSVEIILTGKFKPAAVG